MKSPVTIPLVIFFAALIILLSVYFNNPSGTASVDIRGRIFGHIPYTIQADSNAPTLKKGDIVIASTYAYRNNIPKIGDMVAFLSPNNRGLPWVKRVVALPGDRIAINSGVVYLNDIPIKEPYILDTNRVREYSNYMEEKVIPKESIFVLGDNRDNSMDSRHFGHLPLANLIGRVKLPSN